MEHKLQENELQDALTTLPGWQLQDGELVRTVAFDDFQKAIAFVNGVATLAESAAHHPDIDIRYNKVRLALMTHDSGGITKKDIRLAGQIEQKL